MGTALIVWPLQCSSCRSAWTYPRASSLTAAYMQASVHGWSISINGPDPDGDYLKCPPCTYRHPQRTENP